VFTKKTLKFLDDHDLWWAVLAGLQHRFSEMDSTLAHIKEWLKLRTEHEQEAASSSQRPRRRFSAAARKRMAEAQRRRWEEYRAAKKRKSKGG